jgi:hypothetical protein
MPVKEEEEDIFFEFWLVRLLHRVPHCKKVRFCCEDKEGRGRGRKKLFTWAPNWLSAALRVAAVSFGGTSVLQEVGLCFVLGHIQKITLD